MSTPNIPAHEIIIARSESEIQQCYDVRIAVFHIEQKFPLETEIDESAKPPSTSHLSPSSDSFTVSRYDTKNTATHFLLRLTPSLTPVGTIRGYIAPGGNYYKLSRLAVLKEYRNFQFGRQLVLALHDWVKAHALSAGTTEWVEIVLHSQLPVKGFYAKFEYHAEVRWPCTPEFSEILDRSQGPEFDEDGDPHQKMVLRLPL